MSLTWRGEEDLVPPRPDARGLLRALARGLPLLLLLAGGLALLLAVRVIERPVCRHRRPVTPWITVGVCRAALPLLGLSVIVSGQPLRGGGALVANHASWIDVFALNAQRPLIFVAKSEVRGWPGIGWLAQATGTLFIRREARADVAAQAGAVASRLRAGQVPVLFAEGTTTDNRRVLPFRPALLAGLLAPGLSLGLRLQPVTLSYRAPAGEDPRFYAWYGGADFAPHALAVLAARRGALGITFHEPIAVAGRDRKSLAAEAEARVRAAL